MPVQGFAPLPVTKTDKRPGEAAAGAGQAGQMVEQADRRQAGNLTALTVWKRQEQTGGEDSRKQSPDRAGICPCL